MGGRDSQRFGRSAAPFAWQVARALARTERAELRGLATLYPPELFKIDEDCLARESALATLYPPEFHAGESTFEDFEEFVEVPPFFTGNPNYL